MPIGPNNRIEPGGPDMGQPSHFEPGRKTGMFLVKVPKDVQPEGPSHLDHRRQRPVDGDSAAPSHRLQRQPVQRHRGWQQAAVSALRRAGPGADGSGRHARQGHRRAPRPYRRRSPLTVWVDDDAKFSSGSSAPLREPPPPVDNDLVEVPRDRAMSSSIRAEAEDRDARGRPGEPAVSRQGHHPGAASATRASTSCMSSPTTIPATAAAAKCAAGRSAW